MKITVTADMKIRLLEEENKQLKDSIEDYKICAEEEARFADNLQKNYRNLKQKLEKIEEFLDSHTAEDDPIRPLYKGIIKEKTDDY